MCGICGFNWNDPALLGRMMDVQAHRGPDAAGAYADERVSLGHRRLSIIDLSDAGRQPMASADGRRRIVFNGEIYNYVELAAELRSLGHTFRTRTDTEVILRAYDAWGEACLHRFNGMFAFAIYDAPARRLFLARDRFGVKPLHFRHAGPKFIFASEIKAILQHPDVPRRPDPLAVYDYLALNCYNHTERTFFDGIVSLGPGECLTLDLETGRAARAKWYEIPLGRPCRCADPREVVGRFRDLFFDAIRLRLTRSDVEVGSCLSGGLDSSSIVCSLGRLGVAQAAGHQTFSIVFPGTSFDESRYVDDVVALTGLRGHSVTSTADRLLDDLDRIVYHQEEPFGAPGNFAQWEVMRLARSHGIEVLLDGQGGDELLAGYYFFMGYLLLEYLASGRPGLAAAEAVGLLRHHGLMLDPFLAAVLFSAPASVKAMLGRRYFRVPLVEDFRRRMEGASDVPARMYSRMSLNQALAYRMKFSLPQLLREEDRNSMAFSIESRLPFLDYRLVEFLFSLGPEWKVRRGMTKHILREAMRGILPDRVRLRTYKLGFPTPFTRWLREPRMQQLAGGILGSESFRSRGYLDAARIRQLYADHLAGRTSVWQTMWKAINLELWLRKFID
ncbi:MAG: asparagine synthase (glutamine-hydrolyzing) [Planctomycetes bacterium]|nr:asparagine synthase (glutamine-hydrolyzing) [Planctomycetota bacterium]